VFRRKSLPLGVLVMLLVLALASLGIGYGLWSKILFINGTVATGNVDAELTLDWFKDNEDIKDVGTCFAELRMIDGATQYNKLHIEVGNAYPSYECMVRFDVHSKGSIPVLVYQPDFSKVPPEVAVDFGVVDCYPNPVQLHQSNVAYCTLVIHVKQEAEQNATYDFEGTIEARQFNEPRK